MCGRLCTELWVASPWYYPIWFQWKTSPKTVRNSESVGKVLVLNDSLRSHASFLKSYLWDCNEVGGWELYSLSFILRFRSSWRLSSCRDSHAILREMEQPVTAETILLASRDEHCDESVNFLLGKDFSMHHKLGYFYKICLWIFFPFIWFLSQNLCDHLWSPQTFKLFPFGGECRLILLITAGSGTGQSEGKVIVESHAYQSLHSCELNFTYVMANEQSL